MTFYWELIEKDGTRHDIAPDDVPKINKLMGNHDPVPLKAGTIPFSEIKHFRASNKSYGQQPLLEAVAQAFREPIYQEAKEKGVIYHSVACQWVKKPITAREYDSHYSKIPAYRNLGTDNGMVMVAFKVPIHEVDTVKTTPCTTVEEEKLWQT